MTNNTKIRKRDGREVDFNVEKIELAISKAAKFIGVEVDVEGVAQSVSEAVKSDNATYMVEDIQNLVEEKLKEHGYESVQRTYRDYRNERTKARDKNHGLMKTTHAIGIETDRDNANVGNNFSSKLLRIASETNKWHNLAQMPDHLSKLHEKGDLYYHDLDSENLTINCLHLATGDVFKKGFNTGYGYIHEPNSIEVAGELSCILLQSSQNDMFGGQSHVNYDNDLAPYVDKTRQKVIAEYMPLQQGMSDEKFHELVEASVKKHVHQAMQGVCFNLNTMHSRAGSQVPFSSINIGVPLSEDAAIVCEALLLEYEKGMGKGEQPIFPNIIFRMKEGVNRSPKDPYYYLFKLACRVAAKRMNPTFMNLDSDFNLKYYNMGILPATMGCRTYVCSNVNGPEGPGRRGNNAPVTINLPRLGILANGNVEKFFQLLDERLNDAKDYLLYRYDIVKQLKVKDLPFVAGQELMLGSEGLGPNDSIEPILKQGSWAIGFIGIAETLTALIGKHHGEDETAKNLSVEIVEHIRNYTDRLTAETHLNWGCYATPAEGLSGKFVPMDRKNFGEIKGVTDKDYYTNSYHIPVSYPISIIDKIQLEAPFHKLCNSGHISYIEVDGYPSGETIEKIVTYAFTESNISYIGINFHLRYCTDCGAQVNDGAADCPKCGSQKIQGVSRVTGYLSLDERFGAGKHAEREDRISHGTSKKVYTI